MPMPGMLPDKRALGREASLALLEHEVRDRFGTGLYDLRRDGGELIVSGIEASMINSKSLTLDETKLTKLAEKRSKHGCWHRGQHTDPPSALGLRARRKRPCRCCRAEKRDELAPSHFFTPA